MDMLELAIVGMDKQVVTAQHKCAKKTDPRKFVATTSKIGLTGGI